MSKRVEVQAMSTLPIEDLDAIVACLDDQWSQLRGADVMVTGGTGFFGVWLVSTLLHASARLGLGLRVHVVCRRPEQLLVRLPELCGMGGLELESADVRDYKPAVGKRITHLIHAATSSSAALNASDPVEMAHIAADGTRNLLAVAQALRVERMLFTSSGAVYGKSFSDALRVREEQMGAVDPLVVSNAYAEGKRLAELYCAAYIAKHRLPVLIARCFAFVGPWLPIDTHFAIGNFMRDAMVGKAIVVEGDGSTRRSYLYAADLVVWLLRVLFSGVPGRPYNVGSERDVSVAELAALVGAQRGVPVEICGARDSSRPIDSYVPSTERIRGELGVTQMVSLEEGLRRTMDWYERRAATGVL